MEIVPCDHEIENVAQAKREIADNNNNNNLLGDDIQNWLLKNANEEKWKEPREELCKKGYFLWEEYAMLYYLMKSGKYSRQFNSEKIWSLMKNEYEFLPHRSTKSLATHFEQILQWGLSQFHVSDEVIATIISHRITE
ncbi:hypothetical protein KQX54_000846 [Cotesia glomerata]|uniref:Uncharacterized protein n=2 Tax=Cotesia glomerata TaxID=32391 RepID=A0AAV7I199_COTGL|nr:hypothetical protein KQX54_000846 [Cotesia glomerata]